MEQNESHQLSTFPPSTWSCPFNSICITIGTDWVSEAQMAHNDQLQFPPVRATIKKTLAKDLASMFYLYWLAQAVTSSTRSEMFIASNWEWKQLTSIKAVQQAGHQNSDMHLLLPPE